MSKYQHTQPAQTKITQKRVKRLSTDVDYDLLMKFKLMCTANDVTYQQVLEALFRDVLDGKRKVQVGDAHLQISLDL